MASLFNSTPQGQGMAQQPDFAKVKRNIQRMINQGAPETDIDAYVKSEGTTPDALRAFKGPYQGQAMAGRVQSQPAQAAPIEVELPDGTVAEFPAGTSPDVMKSALQKMFPPQGQVAQMPNGDLKAAAQKELLRRGAIKELERRRGLQSAPDFAAQAAALDPVDLSIARSKNDGFGAFLRGEAQKPVAGEAPETRDVRLYGQPMAGPSKMQSGLAGVADMAGMGFGDEMSAVMQSAIGPETYSQALAGTREAQEILQAENPKSYLAGQVAGTLPAALATGGLGAQSTLGRMGIGAATGTGQGAAYGFGSGEGGFMPRLENAAAGAVFGGAIGAAAPLAISGVSGLGGKIGQALKGFAGADSFATNKIAQAAQQAGMTADDFTARMAQAGPDGMMIDQLGDAGRRLGRTVADRGGQGANELLEATMQRQASHADRITGALSKELGDPSAFYSTLDDVSARLKTAAKPYYERAFQTDAQMTPALDAVAKRIPAPAIKQAQQIAAAEGQRLDAMPLVQRMDYLKRGLDDLIKMEDGKGAAGGFTDYGRALVGLKNNLLSEVDGIAPDYATARKVFSDDLSLKRALESGRKAISADPELTARTMSGMTEGEKELFRIGVSRELVKQIGNRSTDTADAIRKVWTPNRRTMLETVFGNRAGFERFAGQIAKEQEASATYAALHGGSKTARYMSDAGQGGLDGETALRALSGDTRGAIRRALSGFTQKAGGMSETSATKIAQALMGGGDDRTVKGIAAAMEKAKTAAQKRQVIANMLTQMSNQNKDTRQAAGMTGAAAMLIPILLGKAAATGARDFMLAPLGAGR